MKDTYVYPAIFSVDEKGISITFPDLAGCYSFAEKGEIEKAMKRAKEAMQLHLYGLELEGGEIPDATLPSKLEVSGGEFVVMVEAWMPAFRASMTKQKTRRVIQIPTSLDLLARNEGVDYSALMEETLKRYLGVK